MDSYQGDLADIVRATAATTSTTINEQMQDWRFGSSNPDLYPFSDPLLHDMDQITNTGLPFTDMGLLQVPMSVPAPVQENINNYSILSRSIQIPSDRCNNSNSISNRNSDDNNNSSNNNIDKVKLPVSPSRVIKPGYGLVTTEMMMVNASVNGFKDGFIDNTTEVQIPSPRNPGIKRRKSQAKKVVCIPAPAAANSRQTGEVVPSDLWAWRKYGQKPIKGSPYPRGYYRCSSSKGCSARKQVERSRTDPNMLVITYTSEHNHPWPTQRNALAGSTRSQPSKINVGTASPKPFSSPHTQTATDDSNNYNNNYNHNNDVLVKEELSNDQITSPESNNYYANSSTKDENVGTEYKVVENYNRSGKDNLDPSDLPSYRPVIPEHSSQQSDQDFFADLVGFEGDDPLNLLFIQENKAFSPFSAGGIFDWGPPSSTNATNNDLDKYSTIYNGQGEGKS